MKIMNYELRMMFLDWSTNGSCYHLPIEKFAEKYGVTVDDARILIGMGQKYHERNTRGNTND